MSNTMQAKNSGIRHDAAVPQVKMHAAAVTAAGLGGVAWFHAMDLPDKIKEIPWEGVAFVGLIIVSLALAVRVLARRDHRSVVAAAVVAGATVLAWVISRAVGLPGGAGEVGEWVDPIALWAGASALLVLVGSGLHVRSNG